MSSPQKKGGGTSPLVTMGASTPAKPGWHPMSASSLCMAPHVCLALRTQYGALGGASFDCALSVMRRVGVALDIDGVLVRGRRLIPGANEALALLRRHEVPHVLLTNGGGDTEEHFAQHLAALGIEGVTPAQIVLAHTPAKLLVPALRDELVVVLGRKHPVRAARAYGFRLACTPEQYCSVHDLYPFEQYREPMSDALRHAIQTQPVAAALVFSDPVLWGRDIQLLVDLQHMRPGPGALPPRHAPLRIVCCNADLHWSHSFPLPRFGQGAFHVALRSLHRAQFGTALALELMGKPTRATYDYCTGVLGPCEQYYGVGDNQQADIAGANAAGPRWRSVLVRTGLWTGTPLVVQPHHICDDVLHAVRQLVVAQQ